MSLKKYSCNVSYYSFVKYSPFSFVSKTAPIAMMESSLNVSVLCVYKHKHDTKTWLDWVSDMPWLVIKQMFQCHLITLRCNKSISLCFKFIAIHSHTKKTNENDNLNKVLNSLSSFYCAKLNLLLILCRMHRYCGLWYSWDK